MFSEGRGREFESRRVRQILLGPLFRFGRIRSVHPALHEARDLVAGRIADLADHKDPKGNKAEGDQSRRQIIRQRPVAVRCAQRP